MVSESDTERCVSEDVGLPMGWIMRSHIGWKGERNIPYKGVKISPLQMHFKIMRLTTIHNRPKWTISTSSELQLLHNISTLVLVLKY